MLPFPSPGWHQGRTDDDFADVAAAQHGQGALVQVHDGVVRPPPGPHILICMEAHHEEVPHAARLLPAHSQPQCRLWPWAAGMGECGNSALLYVSVPVLALGCWHGGVW